MYDKSLPPTFLHSVPSWIVGSAFSFIQIKHACTWSFCILHLDHASSSSFTRFVHPHSKKRCWGDFSFWSSHKQHVASSTDMYILIILSFVNNLFCRGRIIELHTKLDSFTLFKSLTSCNNFCFLNTVHFQSNNTHLHFTNLECFVLWSSTSSSISLICWGLWAHTPLPSFIYMPCTTLSKECFPYKPIARPISPQLSWSCSTFSNSLH